MNIMSYHNSRKKRNSNKNRFYVDFPEFISIRCAQMTLICKCGEISKVISCLDVVSFFYGVSLNTLHLHSQFLSHLSFASHSRKSFFIYLQMECCSCIEFQTHSEMLGVFFFFHFL